MSWCCPIKVLDIYHAWNRAKLVGLEKKFWNSLLFSVIWSIWNIRNRVVFEDVKPDWELKRRQVKLMEGYRIKSWLGDRKLGGDELCSNPSTLRKWRY